MSQQQPEFRIPPETLGWRLRRALEWGGVAAKDMAAELDVSDGTISRWCHDLGAPPRSIYLRAWANKCRVPEEWLIFGDNDANGSHRIRLMQDPSSPPSTDEVLAHAKRIPELREQLGYGQGRTNRRAGQR